MSVFTKESYIDDITEALGFLEHSVELYNAINKYSIDIEAESFYAGLLNVVFGFKLKNANHGVKNVPSIDLFEECTWEDGQRTAVQVTSDNSPKKIRKTIRSFVDRKYDEVYTRLIILNITRKKKYTSKFSFEGRNGFVFDQNRDILDVRDLLTLINSIEDIEHLQRIHSFLEREINRKLRPSADQNVTESVQKRILQASINQRKELFEGTNKFGGLDIFENLFPNAEPWRDYDEPVGVDQEGHTFPVMKYYEMYSKENILLEGEGGIGKTTFLAHLLKQSGAKTDRQMIPFYIELNNCPPEIGDWYSAKLKKTNFITRYIASLIDFRELETYSTDELVEIERELDNAGECEYLLLLDGFNEVNVGRAIGRKAGASIRELLRQEIEVLGKYAGVRLMLTSRPMADSYFPEGFRKIKLKGLEDDRIVKYLERCRFSELDIKWICSNYSLMHCLRIPLFLCMFASRGQYEKIHPTTRGEILYHFFHRGTPFYSEKKNIRNVFATQESDQTSLSFIVDFLLPALAYAMYDQGIFQIPKKRICKYIKDALACPLIDYAVQTSGFCEYENETNSLNKVFVNLREVPEENILFQAVNVLGIISSGTGQGVVRYSFIHHHIRDYFAAYYIIQSIRCGLHLYDEYIEEHRGAQLGLNDELFINVRGALEPIYYEKLDYTLRRYVGEVLGEHRNTPRLEDLRLWKDAEKVFEEQDTLENVLNMFRYQSVNPRNVISNIVEIFKTVRGNLSSENFNGLDLRNCCFYETICSVGMGVFQRSASFRDCRISDQTFWFRGHLGKIIDVYISKNESLLFSFGEDDQVCIWDLPSLQLKTHYTTRTSVYYGGYSPYTVRIIVNGANEFLLPAYTEVVQSNKRMTIKSEIGYYMSPGEIKYLTEEGEDREISAMCFTVDARIVGVWGNNTIRVFDMGSGEHVKTLRYQVPGQVTDVNCTRDNKVILHTRIEEDPISKTVLRVSRWAFYSVDMTTGTAELLLEYDSTMNVMSSECAPLFAANENGELYLYYSEGVIYLFDVINMTNRMIWQMDEGAIPERGRFLDIQGTTAVVQWSNIVLYIYFQEDRYTILQNDRLKDIQQCAFGGTQLFFLNEEGALYRWDLTTDETSDELLPRIKLEISDIQQDYAGNTLVSYNNGCILTIEPKEVKLLDTFFMNQIDTVLETSLFIKSINRQLIVIRTSEYEQLLLYDNQTGLVQRVDIYSQDQLVFRTAVSVGNILYIAFDKKVIALDVASMKQSVVWSQAAGEVVFDIEAREDSVALLLQWRMLCKRPEYLIFRGDVEEGFRSEEREKAEYIKASDISKLSIWKHSDVEYYGMDAISDKAIYTMKGFFSNAEDPVMRRFFVSVKNTVQFSNSLMMNPDYVNVTQFDSEWIVTVMSYAEISAFDRKKNRRVSFVVSDKNDPEQSVGILDAVMSKEYKLYCRTVEDKIIQVNGENGVIERTLDLMPGIIVSGCDFTGAEVSESVRKVLGRHGGVCRN